MKKSIRMISLVTAVVILATTFVACSGKKKGVGGNSVADLGMATEGLPIVTKPVTLKYWTPLHNNASKLMHNLGENPIYKELEKRTGIKIEFIHPAQGQEREQFNLLIASGDYPDIIQSVTEKYFGVVSKGIEDNIYIKLNDLVDKYAPNFKKILDTNKGIKTETVLDDGTIWSFPQIHTKIETPWMGPIVRRDWLNELGLKAPETINEWYTTLKAFKEKKGIESPLAILKLDNVFATHAFVGAYGATKDFINENGTVKYGPIEPGYKQFLETFNKWYSEGLIDKDFALRDKKTFDTLVTSGKAGAWLGSAGGQINMYMVNMGKVNPKVDIAAAPYPVVNKGENVKLAFNNTYVQAQSGQYTVITSACKYPEVAVRWLDYHYGEEGARLFNYGIENEGYKMVDGKPVYTDLITKNPEGMPYDLTAWKYKVHEGPYYRDIDAIPEISPVVSEARNKVWNKAGSEYVMPKVLRTFEEDQKYSAVMSEVSVFVDEMSMKFILGTEPLSKFDDYVSQIKKLGIENAIKIQQAALERYNKR